MNRQTSSAPNLATKPSQQPASPAPKGAGTTPMMAQYIEIKTANPDCLLFYRMGDFYELFFDDALIASGILGIALTKRGKHQGQDIPMCGVPVHAADDYLQKLIASGQRVAVCEQMEDPAEAKKRGSKAVVRRDVVRLVTPGTLTEDALLDPSMNNFLAALAVTPRGRGEGAQADQVQFGVAWIDISTGEFQTAEASGDDVFSLLAQIEPREIIVSERVFDSPELHDRLDQTGAAIAPQPPSLFDSVNGEKQLTQRFNVATMDSFGSFSRAELAAAGAVLSYIEQTQFDSQPALSAPRRSLSGTVLQIDAATRTNLELFRTLSGSRRGSLLFAIDRTVTAAGSRLLSQRLAAPLGDVDDIDARLGSVSLFLAEPMLASDLADQLRGVPDMVRALSRLVLGRGRPRDLGHLAAGLNQADEIAEILGMMDLTSTPELSQSRQALATLPADFRSRLTAALNEELPHLVRDGGFVREGYHDELDQARQLRDETRRVIAALQSRYVTMTGVKSLKIRHNNVLGYFVEVTAANAQALQNHRTVVPLDAGQNLEAGSETATFTHRQTMANAMRFTTAELAELESRIASAAEQAMAIERQIFDELVSEASSFASEIRGGAMALAVLDVAVAGAKLANDDHYVRPEVDNSLAFAIVGGRHPVVEQALRSSGESFVANNCDLGSEREEVGGQLWLLTGPNMAGKSTFLRQNALIAIMAQAGLFVPAKSAHIGLVDKLFSRVGAADDLAQGRSTFMVEMVETAAILNQAGPRSLVILDEIGRGTATFDGLSIAWACVEQLHEANRCRALFATHYHELTGLSARLDRLHNATMRVREWKGDVVFLHEVADGAADRSYGIQVAKLAGLPQAVLKRAREVLDELEADERKRGPRTLFDDLPLFAGAAAETDKPEQPDLALVKLDEISADDLTPRAALDLIYELKRLRRDQGD